MAEAKGGSAVQSAEYAYETIRAQILAGKLAPGSVISQVQLAAQLGVSRTPLREGLRRLEAEGLVSSDFNRRVTISRVSLPDLDELYGMRLSLEPLAVRVSVPYLSARELDEVEEALHRTVATLSQGDMDGFQVAHREFHLGLVRRCGARLRRSVADLWDQAERYRREYLHEAQHVGTVTQTNCEHTAIFEAARGKDGELCAQRLTRHLLRTALTIFTETDGRAYPLAIKMAVAPEHSLGVPGAELLGASGGAPPGEPTGDRALAPGPA